MTGIRANLRRFWRWLFDLDEPLIHVQIRERKNPWT